MLLCEQPTDEDRQRNGRLTSPASGVRDHRIRCSRSAGADVHDQTESALKFPPRTRILPDYPSPEEPEFIVYFSCRQLRPTPCWPAMLGWYRAIRAICAQIMCGPLNCA